MKTKSNVINLQEYVTDLKLVERLAKRHARKAVTESKAQELTNERWAHLDQVFMQFDAAKKRGA